MRRNKFITKEEAEKDWRDALMEANRLNRDPAPNTIPNLLTGSYRHGSDDFTGPNWSDGKWQSSVAGYATARNPRDQQSKEHDGGIARGEERFGLDMKYFRNTFRHDPMAATAVGLHGLYHGLTKKKTMGPKRMRGGTAGNPFVTPAKRKNDGSLVPNLSAGRGVRITQNPVGQPVSSVARDLFNPRRNPANPNTPATTQAAGRNMQNGGAEVPIHPTPKNISKIHPDHFTIRLPFTATLRIPSTQSMEFTNDNPVALLRLNSIYDPLKQAHTGVEFPIYSAFTTAVATTATQLLDPTTPANTINITQTANNNLNTRPQGRDIWAAHFKYYRVLRSDVKVTWLNNFCCPMIYRDIAAAAPTEAERLEAFQNDDATLNSFIVGYELADENALLSNNADMFRMTKNAERTILPRGEHQVRGNATFANSSDEDNHPEYYNYSCTKPGYAETHFTYMPELWTHHVENKGEETRWTAVGSNPTIDHFLALRAFHLYNLSAGGGNQRGAVPRNAFARYLTCVIQIEYEVQFIECLDSFYKVLQTTTSTES